MGKKEDPKVPVMDGLAADFFRETFRTSLDNCVEELKLLQHIADRSGFMVTKNPSDYSPPQRLFIKTFLSEFRSIVESDCSEIERSMDDEKAEDEGSCQQKT